MVYGTWYTVYSTLYMLHGTGQHMVHGAAHYMLHGTVHYLVQSTKYKVQSTKYKIQSTKYKVQRAKGTGQSTKYKVQWVHIVLYGTHVGQYGAMWARLHKLQSVVPWPAPAGPFAMDRITAKAYP